MNHSDVQFAIKMVLLVLIYRVQGSNKSLWINYVLLLEMAGRVFSVVELLLFVFILLHYILVHILMRKQF